MSDYEIRRERIVEREVPVTGRRVVVERGYGRGGPVFVAPLIAAAVVILLLLLILGVFTH
ncbi:MAG: hypothetical protein QOD30_915 [Actinomycetota bacterium]|nr:hypothetical protein [Actinomycetota bacterium]